MPLFDVEVKRTDTAYLEGHVTIEAATAAEARQMVEAKMLEDDDFADWVEHDSKTGDTYIEQVTEVTDATSD